MTSLASRHSARIAVMNARVRKLERALSSQRQELERGRKQVKRHRQRVSELQDLLSRVMPEREEAIAKVAALQKQYDREIKMLHEGIAQQREEREAVHHKMAEAEKVTG